MPTYASYQATCVLHQQNHTLLSSNLNAAAFNFASDNGHSTIFKGLADYDSLSADSCVRHSAEARRSYDALVQDVVILAARHAEVASDALMVQNCVNMTEMNSLLRQAGSRTDTDTASTSEVSSLGLQSFFFPFAEFTDTDITSTTSTTTTISTTAASTGTALPALCSEPLVWQSDGTTTTATATATATAIDHNGTAPSGLLASFIPPAELFNCSSALPTCRITCSGKNQAWFLTLPLT